MPIAQLTPLPDAPSRNDAPENFTAKADASLAAQKRMVGEFNQAIGGINDFSSNTTSTKGAALIGFIQDLSGASGRDVAAKLRETVSVKDFGAVGDGATDDTAAIQKAVDSISAGTIRLPRGSYKISAPITVANKNILLAGDGQNCSSLIISHAGKGIVYTSDNRSRHASIRRLSILTTNAAATVGVDVTFTATTSLDQVQFSMESVAFATSGSGSWVNGCVRGENLTNPTFSRCVFKGTYATTSYGLSLEGQCLDVSVSQSRFYLTQSGVKLGGTSEGLTLSEVAMVTVRWGVDAQSAGYEPWLALTNTHINATERCVRAVNRGEITISNSLLYATSAAGDTTDWAAIDISSVDPVVSNYIQISNTQMNKSSFTGTTSGIIIKNCKYITITNVIFGPMAKGIVLNNVTNYQIDPSAVFNGVTTPITIDDLPSNLALAVDNTARAQNGVKVLGAVAGNSPTIQAYGTDTDLGLNLSALGGGAVSLNSTGRGVAFRAAAPLNAVNRLRAVASTAGSPVLLQFEGSDTNGSVQLSAKGTGAVILGARNYADDAAAATGGVPVGGTYHTNGVLKVRLS